jgi:hypothetical protein
VSGAAPVAGTGDDEVLVQQLVAERPELPLGYCCPLREVTTTRAQGVKHPHTELSDSRDRVAVGYFAVRLVLFCSVTSTDGVHDPL